MASYPSTRLARAGARAGLLLVLVSAPAACVDPADPLEEGELGDPPAAINGPTVPTLRRTFAGDPGGLDTCRAIDVAPDDAFVVTGEVRRIVQGHNQWTRKYLSNGNPQWTHEASTPSSGSDRGNHVIARLDGAIVAGQWYSGATADNAALTRLSSTGAQQWRRETADPGPERYRGLAQDSTGALIAVGDRLDAGVQHAWIRKLSADGASEQWSLVRAGGTSSAAKVVAAGNDELLVVGHEQLAGTGRDGWIARHDAAGALLWSAAVSTAGVDELVDVAVGANGSFAVVGSVDGQALLRAYGPTGVQAWQQVATDGSLLRGVAIDAANNLVVTGSLGADLIVRKYKHDGLPVWQYTWTGAAGHAITTDGQDRVYVCGAENTSGGGTDGLVLRYQP